MAGSWRILWSPWRYEYIRQGGRKNGCLLCRLPSRSDRDAYIVYRGRKCYIVLNAYPYNVGHVMIVPYRHISSITEMDDDEAAEAWKLTSISVKIMLEALKADGVNIGVNIGRAAGAGIEGHVHIHVVPRWVGDTNFLPVTSDTKSLPVALDEMYRILREEYIKRLG